MKLPFKIAFRFLKSSRTQTFLIILGIAIGVSVQVFIGSLIQGLQVSLIDKTIGNSSQVTVVANEENKLIDNYEAIVNDINNANEDITVVVPVADASGFIEYNDKTNPILLRGFNLDRANKIYQFNEKIIEGREPINLKEVILGKNLKEKLKVTLNEKITIITPKGNKEELIIVGFYDLKISSINSSWVVSTIETTQQIFNYDNKITSIETQVEDVFSADIIAKDLQSILLNNDIEVLNWKEQNEELLSGLSGQSISSYMIQVFVLLSVVLGIASVLAISVIQKSKQIGILKAMGIKERSASLIFLFQGLLLGVGGAILGIGLGLGLSIVFTKFLLLLIYATLLDIDAI